MAITSRVFLQAMIFGATLSGCAAPVDSISSLGTLERDRIQVTAETGERITELFVHEGARVEAGAPLMKQDVQRINISLRKARADESVVRAALEQAEAGPRQQQISAARARVEGATSALDVARSELQRTRQLFDRKLVPQKDLDISEDAVREAEARTQELEAHLDELVEGTRSEELDQLRSRYAAARAVVQNLELTLTRSTIRSPVTGTIDAIPFKTGEQPRPGDTVIALLASDRIYASVHIVETVRSRITNGTPAEVRLIGSEEVLAGHVRWISSLADFTPHYALNQFDGSRLSFRAEIDLDENRELPVGVPVEVTFPEHLP